MLPVETIGSDLADGVLEDPIRSSRRLSASNYHDLTLRFKLAGELSEIVALEAAHGRAVLLAALERAVTFRRWRAADVRSILAAGPGAPQPTPAGDALLYPFPAVPTRSLDDYRAGELG